MSRAETAATSPNAPTAVSPRRAELERQRDILLAAIGDLQGRLDAVERELSVPEVEPPPPEPTVLERLREQATALATRSEAVMANAVRNRQGLRDALAADARSSAVLAEYEQFESQMRPVLENMPEGYRSALLTHHQQVSRRLAALVAAKARAPSPLDADPLIVDLVYAVDAPDGAPELLVVVAPLDEAVSSQWSTRTEDFQTWIAARIAGALYEALAAAGVPAAEVASGGHEGLLALECEVSGASADLAAIVGERLSIALSAAGEITAARVEVVPQSIDIDLLLPPEENRDA